MLSEGGCRLRPQRVGKSPDSVLQAGVLHENQAPLLLQRTGGRGPLRLLHQPGALPGVRQGGSGDQPGRGHPFAPGPSLWPGHLSFQAETRPCLGAEHDGALLPAAGGGEDAVRSGGEISVHHHPLQLPQSLLEGHQEMLLSSRGRGPPHLLRFQLPEQRHPGQRRTATPAHPAGRINQHGQFTYF